MAPERADSLGRRRGYVPRFDPTVVSSAADEDTQARDLTVVSNTDLAVVSVTDSTVSSVTGLTVVSVADSTAVSATN